MPFYVLLPLASVKWVFDHPGTECMSLHMSALWSSSAVGMDPRQFCSSCCWTSSPEVLVQLLFRKEFQAFLWILEGLSQLQFWHCELLGLGWFLPWSVNNGNRDREVHLKLIGKQTVFPVVCWSCLLFLVHSMRNGLYLNFRNHKLYRNVSFKLHSTSGKIPESGK